MTYLERLKALDSENVANIDTALTAKSLVKAPYDSFGSNDTGQFLEISPDFTSVNQRDPLDDRRYCRECFNLTSKGRCLAAWRGEIMAGSHYHPIDDIPRRCEGFTTNYPLAVTGKLDRLSLKRRFCSFINQRSTSAITRHSTVLGSGGSNLKSSRLARPSAVRAFGASAE